MDYFGYNADFLPRITLIGKDETDAPHKNIDRVSPDYVFYFVTDGELFFCEDGTEYRLQKGDCFLFEPGKHHYGTVNSNYHLIYVHFSHPDVRAYRRDEAEWYEMTTERKKRWLTSTVIWDVPDREILLPKLARLSDPTAFSAVLDLCEKAIGCSRNRRENYDVLCSCAVNEVFIALCRLFPSDTEKSGGNAGALTLIHRVMAYLHANYQRRLTGAILEKELSYNFDYLNQLFKKNLNVPIFRTLETIRVENAKNLLGTTALPLDRIAESVGFDNESYFSKVFKKRTGLTPSEYRRGQ